MLLACPTDNPLADSWEEALRSAGVDLAVWPDVEENEFAAIRFFICWKPPAEIFPKLTNLTAVQLQGAGVDSVISNPDIPTTVPLLRIADPLMGQRMAMWVSILLQFMAAAYVQALRTAPEALTGCAAPQAAICRIVELVL